MNAEQLNSARLARWSQDGEARLTLEAATAWLAEIGFCPYLPVALTGSAPAPSFLEAVVGRPAPLPSAGERARASDLLARLIENSSAVPLKFGTLSGDQPDFVCCPQALRYIYALRGDRNFKTGPLTVGNEKVTPLSLHCWQAIEQHGPLDIPALQPILGRDITEAAIARALQELWSGMYIYPIIRAGGQPAQWDLMFRRFPKPLAAGASTGHAEAQSAMVSLYLQAVVAAREEEILAFLAPLAPQSKLRETIRGLGSMRQLEILDIAGRAHVALQGGLLPEMAAQLSEELLATAASSVQGEPEIAMEAEIESEAESETEMDSRIQIEAMTATSPRTRRSQPLEGSGAPESSRIKKFVPKKFVPRQTGSRGQASARFGTKFSHDDKPERRPFTGGPRSGPGGASRTGGKFRPRTRAFAASAERGETGSRSGSPRPGRFGQGSARAYQPGSDRSGSDRSGPKGSGPGRFVRDRNFREPRGPRTRESFPGDHRERGPLAGAPKSAGAPKGYAAKGRGMGERAKRWRKTGEVADPTASGKRPFKRRSPAAKPWQSRSFGADAGEGRANRPWKKFEAAGSDSPRSGTRKPYSSKPSGFKPRGGKPWARKSGDREIFSSRPNRSREDGDRPKPWQNLPPSADDRPAEKKPWASRDERSRASTGVGSRIGSAKSYGSRSTAKPYANAGRVKPWARRFDGATEGEAKPNRRMSKAQSGPKEAGGASPRESSGAKPFWAKNPRGGKGSSAASRTNRPRGKKTARKTGKRK